MKYNRLRILFLSMIVMVIPSLQLRAKVTKETVDSVTMFYAGGEYDKCISIANEHERDYCYYSSEEVMKQKLLIYGALSYHSKLFGFQTSDNKSNLTMIFWAMHACDFFDKWLKDHLKYNHFTEVTVSEFFTNLEIALSAYSVISDEMDGVTKRYDKMSSNWIKNAHKKFYTIRNRWSDYPVVQLMILNNAITYYAERDNGLAKLPTSIIDEYWNAIDTLVSMSAESGNSAYTSVIANSYVQQLCNLFLTDIHSKSPNYIGSLDVMLKSRDFSFFVRGATQYRSFKNTSFKAIQNSLEDGEFCIEHFESHVMAGRLYAQWDATTRRRNYAFVFDNKMGEPALWHRGFINNIEKQGFEGVLKDYPECKIVYSTGTDYMALKDYVGRNPMVHRCHSLSHIKDAYPYKTNIFTFIGLIDYGNNSINDVYSPETKGHIKSKQFSAFPTDETLLDVLSNLNIDLSLLKGSNVTRGNLIACLRTSRQIHISSHGTFNELDLTQLNENELGFDAVNGTNVLKNCKLILSGYNDDPSQYISGDDIRKLDLSNLELLFLDACQTGDGRKIGIGSYSLAEAFHIAGVRNIIATLDPIDPKITLNFSTKFYNLLSQGKNIHDSFYAAKNEVCPTERIILWE